ncbi:Transcription factor jumonji/aspartyl beta-hydroxylase [Macrophomina phaseolina MS6]|uniref:Transcription factor jumonji/aspartyl beta-hydroxylase n=1 Tax=Macrophomina phaseolina (strain MS6) TaxID=1126212 RepID=K2R609_MACPH|nr:Transcription factor jumonji/aspartyl beta-hydroxylase [Macrophomina phaseolina MS6]
MAPRQRNKQLPVDLTTIASNLDGITSQLAKAADTPYWPTELFDESKSHAVLIERSADRLLKHARKLVKIMQQQQKRPPEPKKGQGRRQQKCPAPRLWQESELDGNYTGKVKFGLEQLEHRTVFTIFQMVDDFPQCQELGYCKVAIGKDVIRDLNLEEISGSTIDMLSEWQSKAVYLSPRNKRDDLHGLVCHSYIKRENKRNNNYSKFQVPDLSCEDSEHDPRELLCSTVRDAREDEKQSYLVIPTESSSQWLESIGLSTELLDCGEQLKKTARRIPGVHTPYLYISARRGSNSPLHVEDAFLGSINIVLAGAPKVWLMVEPRYREKLELKARQYLREEEEGDDVGYDNGTDNDDDDEEEREGDEDENEDEEEDERIPCSQSIRHLSDLLSPELLDSWEIPYRIVPCNAGEMIITFSETYHQVVNAGPNLAMAINFAADRDWKGPPKNYRFCKTKCTSFPITRAKLRIQQVNLDDLELSNDEEGAGDRSSSNGTPPNRSPHSLQNNSDLSDEELDKIIDANILWEPEDQLCNSEPVPEPPTPGTPGGFNLPTPEPSSIISQSGEHQRDVYTPLEPPETPGQPNDSSCQTPTPPTTVSETSAPQYSGEISQEKGREGGPASPIVISGDEDNLEDVVELPLNGPDPTLVAAEALESRLATLVQRILPFTPALRISKNTIECFRIGCKLNDDAITLTLSKILPESVEPLIASFAILNKPEFGISRRYTGPDVSKSQVPILKHSTESTHLCIACNVESKSLEWNRTGSGDHWILIVVDFQNTKVHVFGDEGGHKPEAEAIAYNIGLFVNNHRIDLGYDPISWSALETHPLYPTSCFPDGYNCGVAVILRAEAFIYPDKALETSAYNNAIELSAKLNELRAVYLGLIYRRCRRVHDDERERYLLTPESINKKRKSQFPEEAPPKLLIRAAQLSQRTAQFPLLVRIPESEAQRWEQCLLRAAEEGGFYPQGILESFRRAPQNQPLHKIVKVLQYICEVASAEILLEIKQLFLDPNAYHGDLDHADDQDVVTLHTQIKKFNKISFIAQAQKFKSQLLYRDWFEQETNWKRHCIGQGENRNKTSDQPARRRGVQIKHCANGNNGKSADNQFRRHVARLIAFQTNSDETSVRLELNQYLHEAQVLHSLLHPQDGGERRELSFLFLLPLYVCSNRSPLLNIMAHGPPITTKHLCKKISSKGLLDFNQELAKFFGGSLSIARPELDQIESCLPRGDLTYHGGQILPANRGNHSGPLRLVMSLFIVLSDFISSFLSLPSWYYGSVAIESECIARLSLRPSLMLPYHPCLPHERNPLPEMTGFQLVGITQMRFRSRFLCMSLGIRRPYFTFCYSCTFKYVEEPVFLDHFESTRVLNSHDTYSSLGS